MGVTIALDCMGGDHGLSVTIPAAVPRQLADPTGCGDAYRAGLIFGLTSDYDLPTVGRIASLMGALKIEHSGTQNQSFTLDEFRQHFREQFEYVF